MIDSLNIAEQFYSIQGEGKTVGVPAYFIRLSDCNLSCGATQKQLNLIRKDKLLLNSKEIFHGDLHKENKASWTCDSISVWIKGKKILFTDVISKWISDDLYNDIHYGIIHIIWTGGEPLIPQNQQAIKAFNEHWNSSSINLINGVKKGPGSRPHLSFQEIETNGTFIIDNYLKPYLSQINCSPKLSNSGMDKKKRINPHALEDIMSHSNYQFKFVVDCEKDFEEICVDFIKPFKIPLNNIYCMPALDDREKYHERSNFICEMAKKYKFNASQRLHISSWGAVTGV